MAPPGSATGSATGAAVLAVLRASRPRCRGRGDVLAFALHAATMAEGYRLLAAGPAADADDPAHASSSDPAAGWNAWEDAYAFRYARDEPAGSPAASASASAPAEPPVEIEILVKTLVVGDAAVISAAVVSAPAATAPSRDRPVHAAEYSLDAVVRGSGSGDEPPSAEDGGTIADAAAALADADALVADAREKLFAPLARDAAARASSAGEEEESDGRRDAVGSRRVRPIPDDDDTGGGGFFPPGTYPPRGSPRAPGPRGVFFPGPAPPRGARFDPYGPPDIPEFAPGRFDGGTLPGFGFPENPDAAFGGVPDGFGGGGAFGGGALGRKAPRRFGRDPDSPRG